MRFSAETTGKINDGDAAERRKMELEILVLPDPNSIGVQECEDEGGTSCPWDFFPSCPMFG